MTQAHFSTSLGSSTPDTITVQGYDLCHDLIGKVDFGSVAFLLVAGRLPTTSEARMFNAVLVTLADHGLTPSALATRLTYTGAPEAVQGAIASGLLGAGSVFLGVLEDTARLLQTHLQGIGGTTDETLRRTARVTVNDLVAQGHRIPGLGHPVHKRADPRTVRLYELAKELGILGVHMRLLDHVAQEAGSQTDRHLPINAAGATGAVLSDLSFDWRIIRGFAVLSRTAGLVAHVWEESQHPIGRYVWDLAEQHIAHTSSAQT